VDAFTLVDDNGTPMVRETFVMDCWFDSGCAPFAQWHHPFDGGESFNESFPVDYICEGVDQTRGWFYTLLAVSTTVFDQAGLQALFEPRTHPRRRRQENVQVQRATLSTRGITSTVKGLMQLAGTW
jgi:hypothetical protein